MQGIYQNLKITAPIGVRRIETLHIEEAYNSHGKAKVTLLLEEETRTEELSALSYEHNWKIEDKAAEKILFQGIATKIDTSFQKGVYRAEVMLMSHTIELDILEKSRSFQKKTGLYQELFTKLIQKEGKGRFFQTAGEGKAQEHLWIQYKETNWTFLLRLLSGLGTVLLTDVTADKPSLFLGFPAGTVHRANVEQYTIQRNIGVFLEQQALFGGEDILVYTTIILETKEAYAMGDKVFYRDTEFRVIKKETVLEQGRLKYTYLLGKEAGIPKRHWANIALQGASLTGHVVEVKTDYAKVQFDIDAAEPHSTEDCCLLPVLTPYTAEGQTGFYSMPEIGDAVSVYFPKQEELFAVIIGGKREKKVTKPEQQRMATPFGKELLLTEQEMQWTAKREEVGLLLSEKGIVLAGKAGIQLNSKNLLRLEGDTIHILAGDRIVTNTKKASILVDTKIQVKG